MINHKFISNIKKAAAMSVFFACLLMLLSPLLSYAANADSLSVLFDYCNHSCDDEDDSPDDNEDGESPVDCPSPCHKSPCHMVSIAEPSAVNAPAHTGKTDMVCSGQFNRKDIICPIFKPPNM
jgi:hypothetical protein